MTPELPASPTIMQPDRFSAPLPPRFAPLRRIAWVTPDYPPDRGGVSDHSSAMVGVLREAGHEVLVCPRPHEHGFAALDAELSEFRPELLVVAYVPLGYAPHSGGIAPAFTRWSIALGRRYGCRTVLMAHEASLPLVDLWQHRQYKLGALAAVQVAQFSIILASFDVVLFSNLGTHRKWARYLSPLATRFHTLRICSNIPFRSSLDPAAELRASGESVPATTILFFGTGHQSVLFDYVEAAFRALLEIDPNAVLVVIGMTAEKLAQLSPSLANLSGRVRALGYVAAPELSLWLQVAVLVLAPLIEGVSARKGTVMAALQHGRTVITTLGVHTLEDIAWPEICVLSPLDRAAFAAKSVAAFRDPALRDKIGRAAIAEYEAHASAQVTARRILNYAN